MKASEMIKGLIDNCNEEPNPPKAWEVGNALQHLLLPKVEELEKKLEDYETKLLGLEATGEIYPEEEG